MNLHEVIDLRVYLPKPMISAFLRVRVRDTFDAADQIYQRIVEDEVREVVADQICSNRTGDPVQGSHGSHRQMAWLLR